jgi:hypothetical protein
VDVIRNISDVDHLAHARSVRSYANK